ncbi:MAG TPA: aminopeptidase N [Stellaceae bacterium]|nr:aminopeptidase N [Stellaceae bacterium]
MPHDSVPQDASAPQPTLLAEYRPPDFVIDAVELDFTLGEDETLVESHLKLRRNPAAGATSGAPNPPLRLDGEELTLKSIMLDGAPLHPERYRVEADDDLTIFDPPDAFTLEIVVVIKPQLNTALSGLYTSGGNFCTQCEAEGFRRITWFLDRPDVSATYRVRITADKARYPVLLSNGNPEQQGDLPDGRHCAIWVDPHPKPSYLLALVAGDLVALKDEFTTMSGRKVALAIWVRRGDEDKCGHAMDSLKASMRWDEETYGLEYDLDVFNIVAVSDFNMGAMENKGLNVFNTRYVLAKPDTATDTDYENIEGVIGHEYFHNWTGDRVTCRDWFQLSLKEGLTVFRDQQFSADMGSAAVCRINDVRALRASQFPEDAGPLAHPVQPQSYLRIDNFYTATVYNKGAELIRMMHTLLGLEGFRRGMDLYIARHDNSAATIPDFVAAMQDASGVDLGDFSRWYHQAGTPEITVEDHYDAASKSYELTVSQRTPPTPGQPEKDPVPVPIAMGLLGPNGDEMPTRLDGEAGPQAGTRLLVSGAARQTFRFVDVPAPPVPSLLRGFSAPVKLQGMPLDRLKFLAIHDTDPVARWDAGQRAAITVLLERVALRRDGKALPPLDADLVAAMRHTLANAADDPAFAAEALTLPSETTLADEMDVVDIEGIHAVREEARASLAASLATALGETYRQLADPGLYKTDSASIGKRALRNACLGYLAAGNPAGGARLAKLQFDAQQNMTDVLAALTVLMDIDSTERRAALVAFYQRWQDDALVVDKWFAIQARSSLPGTIDAVKALTRHSAFTRANPNRLRALVGTFSQANQLHFHDASGAGYAFLADEVLKLDPDNPQVAARMVQALGNWRRFDAARQALMKAQLQRIHDRPGLSTNTFEMVSKSLADA